MRTSKLIGLAYCLFHFQAIKNSKSNIICKDRLNLSVHAFDYEVHTVEHF
jgi:hypothetical protein